MKIILEYWIDREVKCVIELRDIVISYDKKECIKKGHFIAYPNQITGIYGESGVGKSSLLYAIGMLSNQKIDYFYDNKLLNFNDREKAEFRNEHISFIDQNAILIETISVSKNIEFYLKHSNASYSVDQLLKMVHMDTKGFAMPKNLSGGERQRVAIACALAKDSNIILGDELTASLDDENTDLVMNILRECANMGKMVILVTHEINIINKCDRLYKIDHLNLVLEKERKENNFFHSENTIENNLNDVKETKKSLEIFEILFYSNRKNNKIRVLFGIILMAIVFVCSSIIVQNYLNYKSLDTYSVDEVSNRKLLVLSDVSGAKQVLKYGYAMRTVEQFEPLLELENKKLEVIDHVDSVYDYYIFANGLNASGLFSEMSLTARRDGKEIEKIPDTADTKISNNYDFSVIPFYDEETEFNKNSKGVYISESLAYIYQLKVGDTLDLKLNIPFLMCQLLSKTEIEETNISYYPVECLYTQVQFETKVEGITESNSLNNEIYMNYSDMKALIDSSVKEYQDGGIKVNESSFIGYSTLMELKPYAKAVFADKYENVLDVINNIDKTADDIYVYNEYQSVLGLIEENNGIVQQTMAITALCVIVFMIGGFIVETFYIKRYKSTYMMMNLIGYDKKQKNKILFIHALWQILIIVCSSLIVYITASIPVLLVNFKIMNPVDFIKIFPNYYLVYTDFADFSWLHFGIFILMVSIVVSVTNVFMKIKYDKADVIAWIRGK